MAQAGVGCQDRVVSPIGVGDAAAVQLEREQMVVLGQVVEGVGVEDLKVGMPVELVLERIQQSIIWGA